MVNFGELLLPGILTPRFLSPRWRPMKDGFETWHIAVFLVGLIFGNAALVMAGYIDRPTPGKLPLDQLLLPSNPVFRF